MDYRRTGKLREISYHQRSHFHQATTLAFQLTIMMAFLGYVATQLVFAHGNPQWISYQLVPLLTVFFGMLS